MEDRYHRRRIDDARRDGLRGERTGRIEGGEHGISLPGTGEAPTCPIFIDGEHVTTLRGTYEELAAAFQRLVNEYVETRYSQR